MPRQIRLDHGGMGELLKSDGVASLVDDAADLVQQRALNHPSVQTHGMPVETASGVSDRARAIVTIMHAGGLGVQAKHGVLSRAVADTGLSFREVAS